MIDELRRSGLYRKIQQAFAVLLPVQSVGVMGDGRTYEDVIAVRADSDGRFHDGRLVSASLRSLAADFDARDQQRSRSQPRRLRRQLKAPQHDRMGMS